MHTANPNFLLFPEPLLSTSSASLLSFAFATTYVGSIYFSRRTRLSLGSRNDDAGQNSTKGTRDDPDIVRARLLAVSVATVVCCAGVFSNLDLTWDATILRLGLTFLPDSSPSFPSLPPLSSLVPTISHHLLPHLVVPILFFGPLFACFLAEELPGQRRWRWHTKVTQRFCAVHGLRNYVIGPITEELVFRACVLSVCHMAGANSGKMIGFAPLSFGLAHVHHGYEMFHLYGGNAKAAQQAAFNTLFQLTYTTLFGSLASFLFLRTGSVLPPVSAHVFCNIMGFPDLPGEVRRFPAWRRGALPWAFVCALC
ncbi:hypothetical protein BJ912DRAFT_905692 [Pholiota molesta]|nr:hypothetical protein BJ912DRAFT_905692 [Pholiota molesta]